MASTEALDVVPIDADHCEAVWRLSVEAGWNLTRMFGNRRCLVDRYIPFPDLFLNGRSFLVGQRRVEDLADSAFGHGSGRFIRFAGGRMLSIRSLPSGLALFVLTAGILWGLRVKDVIDLLRTHSAKPVIEKDPLGQAESCVNKQRVNGVVTRHIPSLWIAPRTPHMMAQRRMHDLMS